ncbi:hypothetical protein JB92DRAFT_2711024 [Gautieria morchelliformis]|nr:hypothetical protein JB92DRAFT_2711024 [Gautieria morchelliformis]
MASPWKGKARAQETDAEDLNPVITYRHLLSSGLGVRNPLRVCGLSDMDAFYASCEQLRLGLDPSVPLIVRQWDALIAVNYPAREYGISRMDKIASALQRCPHLRVVHVATFDPNVPDAKPTYTDSPNSVTHKVSLDYYRKESKKIMNVFKEMLPGAEVERASIDEAFIDFTEPVRRQILAHFPNLATPPPEGLDIPLPPPPREGGQGGNIWSGLGTLVPISGKPLCKPKKLEDFGDEESNEYPLSDEDEYVSSADAPDHVQSSEASLDADRPLTWHDIALSIAASLMLEMRDEVKTRLGYTTSAGIARNKFLAKLVASYKKRDSQTILRNAAIPNYLRPLPFQKIRFLGGKLGTALAETYEAQTVGDLLGISIEDLQRKFGESSIWVWEILRGIDLSEVKEKPPITKSMGASKNLQHPITHPSEGAHWLRILAGELAFRLQEAREENPGLWPKTLVLHVRQAYDTTRSKQAPFPFTRAASMDFICKAAERLWVELVGTNAEYDKHKAKGRAAAMKITNVFLGFTGVETRAAGQRSIEGFFSDSDRQSKRKAEDGVRAEGSDKRRALGASVRDGPAEFEVGTSLSFRCPRCGQQVRRVIDEVDDREAALDVLKMEHDDFHYAQDLARAGDGNANPNEKRRKKGKVVAKGIAKFFSPVAPKR